MSHPVAHVDSVVIVDGKLGRVLTGASTHFVQGGGGASGDGEVALVESVGMETEDMTAAERRAYLDARYGPGSADAYDRATSSSSSDPGSEDVSGPDVPSKILGCQGITNSTPDSFKVSRYYTVGMCSSQIYQATNSHAIPNQTAKGMSRADVICNLKHVCTNSIDVLKDWVEKTQPGYSFKIGSGFRNQTNDSDHNVGSAIDLHFFKNGARISRDELRILAGKIVKSANIPYTQFLLEYQGGSSAGWIHIANRRSGNSALRIGYSMNGSDFNKGLPISA